MPESHPSPWSSRSNELEAESDEIEARRRAARELGGSEAVEAQHARGRRRVIQDEIEDHLSDALLESRFEAGDRVLIDVQNDEVVLTKASETAAV